MFENITKPGIYNSIPSDFYHNGGIGVSKSELDLIHRSPAHFVAAKNNPKQETPAMLLGTVVHAAVLEANTFEQRYVEGPKVDKRTKAGKEEYAAFELDALTRGLVLVDADMYATALAIRDAAYQHQMARRLLNSPGVCEASVYWRDTETLEDRDLYCKARPDKLLDDMMIVDLKTTDDARPESFHRKIASFRYHVQQAYYSDGVKSVTGEDPKGFVFLVVETSPPYGINIFMLDDEGVNLGRAAYKEDLATYRTCLDAQLWPCYTSEVKIISLPKWAA